MTVPPSGSDLCIQCGLCCNGALFGFVPLTAEEQALPRHRAHGERMPLPCEFLDGRKCTIYGEGPPRVCGEFRCRLLRRFEAGDVTLEDAMEEVAEAHRLHDAVCETLPPDTRLAEAYRELAEGMTSQDQAFDMNRAQRQVALIGLMMYAQEHFRVPQDTASQERTIFGG